MPLNRKFGQPGQTPISNNTTTSSSKSNNSGDSASGKPISGSGGGYSGASQVGEHKDVELVECGKCGRKFVSDRIGKHESVCKGRERPADQKTKEKDLTPLEKYRNPIDHDDPFKVPNQPPASADSRVQCPHCGRRFEDSASLRHIPACAKVVNRAKGLPEPVGKMTSTSAGFNKQNGILSKYGNEPEAFRIHSSAAYPKGAMSDQKKETNSSSSNGKAISSAFKTHGGGGFRQEQPENKERKNNFDVSKITGADFGRKEQPAARSRSGNKTQKIGAVKGMAFNY